MGDCGLEGNLKQGSCNKEELSRDRKWEYIDEVESKAGRVFDEEYQVEGSIEIVTPRVVVSGKKYNTRSGGSRKLLDDAEFVGHGDSPDFRRVTRRGAMTRPTKHKAPAASTSPLSSTPPLPLVIISEFFSSERHHVLSRSRGAPNKSEKDVEDSFLALKVR